MRIEAHTYLTVNGIDTDVTITAEYRASRPAPACSNPDSPAFSDSGDPEEIEVLEIQDDCGNLYAYERLLPHEKARVDEAVRQAVPEREEEV